MDETGRGAGVAAASWVWRFLCYVGRHGVFGRDTIETIGARVLVGVKFAALLGVMIPPACTEVPRRWYLFAWSFLAGVSAFCESERLASRKRLRDVQAQADAIHAEGVAISEDSDRVEADEFATWMEHAEAFLKKCAPGKAAEFRSAWGSVRIEKTTTDHGAGWTTYSYNYDERRAHVLATFAGIIAGLREDDLA